MPPMPGAELIYATINSNDSRRLETSKQLKKLPKRNRARKSAAMETVGKKHTYGGWYDSVTHAKLLDMRQKRFRQRE
jgi:hypothetical protein